MTFRQAQLWMLAAVCFCPAAVDGFSLPQATKKVGQKYSSFLGAVKVKERIAEANEMAETPVTMESTLQTEALDGVEAAKMASLGAATFMTALAVFSETADAIQMPKELTLSSGSFDPNSFVPVCSASDSLYRFSQGAAKSIVGPENFQEYGPLIASGLLRVRLELCVVESFFNEAVGPFIRQNGLSWVLPLHETVETFLAGTVFAIATTFILVGSTKILTVIFTFADFLIGGPLRLLGGFAFDRARGRPVTLDLGFGPFKTRVVGPKDYDVEKNDDWSVDLNSTGPGNLAVIVVSGSAKAVGSGIKLLRDILDSIDLFVGKSLVLWMTAYVGIKFLHFKVFPDFPPF